MAPRTPERIRKALLREAQKAVIVTALEYQKWNDEPVDPENDGIPGPEWDEARDQFFTAVRQLRDLIDNPGVR